MSTATDTAHTERNGSAHVREQTEAMTDLQKNLLLTYEGIGEEWASRLQSEAGLWTELTRRFATARSAPDFFGAYSNCLFARFQMAGDDFQRLAEHYQRMAQQLADALNDGLQSWCSAPLMAGAYPIQGRAKELQPTRTRKRKAR